MKLRALLLGIVGLLVLAGSVAPADAQYYHHHRHYRHHHRPYHHHR